MKKGTNNSGSNSMLTLISVAIIVIFAAASAFMVIPHLQQLANDKAMKNGEQEATVEYLATSQNMSVEDFLAQYGLELNGTITKDTLESEMEDNMTIANYNTYVGEGNAIDLTQFSDAVTEETLYKDLKNMPAKTALGEEFYNTTKQMYNLSDDIVNDETSLADFQTAVQAAYMEEQQAARYASQASDTATDDTAAQTQETDAADAASAQQ